MYNELYTYATLKSNREIAQIGLMRTYFKLGSQTEVLRYANEVLGDDNISDEVKGEANFDINKEDFQEHSPFLAMDMFEKPTKLRAFMSELRDDILSGKCKNELEVVELCFKHGVKRQHAEEVLRELKVSGKIEISFRIPQFTHKPPREIRLR